MSSDEIKYDVLEISSKFNAVVAEYGDAADFQIMTLGAPAMFTFLTDMLCNIAKAARDGQDEVSFNVQKTGDAIHAVISPIVAHLGDTGTARTYGD